MRRLWLVLAVACALFIEPAGTARAADDTPNMFAGARVISAEELRAPLGQGAVEIYDPRKKAGDKNVLWFRGYAKWEEKSLPIMR